MLRARFPGEMPVALEKDLLLTLVRDLNERARTLLEKELHVGGHESKEETRNRLRDSRKVLLPFVILFIFSTLFPTHLSSTLFFSIHPSRCHKTLKHPVDNIKINL